VSVKAPILPVTIDGGDQAWPPGRIFPRPGRITITYHPPLYPDATLEPRAAAQDLSTRTRQAILGALPSTAGEGTPTGEA
jgi:1-acyl-sn-glycerol-3-phosphate acyltransferase